MDARSHPRDATRRRPFTGSVELSADPRRVHPPRVARSSPHGKARACSGCWRTEASSTACGCCRRDRVLAQTRLRDNPEQLDEVSGQACALGVGGYWLSDTRLPPDLPKHLDPPTDTGDHTLVSNGAGGTIAWANLDTGLAVMIVHNRMLPESVPPDQHPFVAIGDTVRAVAGVAPR